MCPYGFSHNSQVPKEWRELASPKMIEKGVAKCAATIQYTATQSKQEVVLLVVLKGGMYFATDLSRMLDDKGVNHSIYTVYASSYRDGQTNSHQLKLEGQLDYSKLNGKQVFIIDELWDTGNTATFISDEVSKNIECPNSVKIITLFIKRYTIGQKIYFYGLRVPDVWLVGYGLDDMGTKRGLRSLYGIPRTEGQKTREDAMFDSDKEYLEILTKYKENL